YALPALADLHHLLVLADLHALDALADLHLGLALADLHRDGAARPRIGDAAHDRDAALLEDGHPHLAELRHADLLHDRHAHRVEDGHDAVLVDGRDAHDLLRADVVRRDELAAAARVGVVTGAERRRADRRPVRHRRGTRRRHD